MIVGTHPIPLKYLEAHRKLPFWERMEMRAIAGVLMDESSKVMEAYN